MFLLNSFPFDSAIDLNYNKIVNWLETSELLLRFLHNFTYDVLVKD